MKTRFKPIVVSLLLLAASISSQAQNYSVDWYKIAGGGGTSTGGNFSVSGTIGQSEASANNTLAGGNYSLTGGFWSLYALQTMGSPNLSIHLVAPNTAIVAWANTGSFSLQTNNNLATTNWGYYGGTVSLSNGTNSASLAPAAGNLFFRLK